MPTPEQPVVIPTDAAETTVPGPEKFLPPVPEDTLPPVIPEISPVSPAATDLAPETLFPPVPDLPADRIPEPEQPAPETPVPDTPLPVTFAPDTPVPDASSPDPGPGLQTEAPARTELPENIRTAVPVWPVRRNIVKYPYFSEAYPARRLDLPGDPEAQAPIPGEKIWPLEGVPSLLQQMLRGE